MPISYYQYTKHRFKERYYENKERKKREAEFNIAYPNYYKNYYKNWAAASATNAPPNVNAPNISVCGNGIALSATPTALNPTPIPCKTFENKPGAAAPSVII